MPGDSVGLLMFRRVDGRLEVLLGHPGGPFWATRQQGAWTIPKGGVEPDEDPLAAAVREFREETGFEPRGPYLPLGQITQRAGKVVRAWAFEGDGDPSRLVSMTVRVEWPPRSGRIIEVPELDRVQFVEIPDARSLINPAQGAFLDRLLAIVDTGSSES